MSSHEIHHSLNLPIPNLIPPTQNHAHAEGVLPTPSVKKKPKISLKRRVIQIPQKFLAFFMDEQWMSVIVDFFGIASRVLGLIGNVGGKFVPYLSIASSPFYLFHAIGHSKERFQLMYAAARTARIADTIFWLGRGIESFGSAVSDIVKPFGGGFELAGLTARHLAIGIVFTMVIPVVLIVFGAIGGVAKGWSLIRTGKVLREFNKRAEKQDGSLEELAEILEYLQGPQVVKKKSRDFILQEKHFNENHFTNDQRREAVQARIRFLMHHHDLQQIRIDGDVEKTARDIIEEHLLDTKTEGIHTNLDPQLQLIENIQELYGKLFTESTTELRMMDDTLKLYKQLLSLIEEGELKEEIEEKYNNLLDLKKEILREGGEIIGTVRSEIHRQLCYHAFFILLAAITLTAGVLLLTPYYHHVGFALAISSSGLSVLQVLFDKTVSQKTFYKMDRFLQNLLEKKSR